MSGGRGASEVGVPGPAGVLPVAVDSAPPVPRRVSRRDLLLRWYLPLLAGLGTLSLGFVAFAALVERHQEIFDLGFRVVLPSLHHPVLTRPLAPLLLAAVLAAAAAVRLAVQGAAPMKGDTP